MARIELSKWEPVPGSPERVRQAGQRTAQEVFEELQYHLENIGYLPDESFLLNDNWNDGKEIPENAEVFCTTGYGSSEGIYLDIYLRWYEDNNLASKSFITGKTLGKSDSDLDRMHLISSAVMKAFHSGGVHARYVQIGEKTASQDIIVHLNENERRTLINSLAETRNHLVENTIAVEQLLRRVTGSITEFVNEVGEYPLDIDHFDKAVIAIQDGSISTFKDAWFFVPEKESELLILAAGRPGAVGNKMTMIVLDDAQNVSNDSYLSACKSAISTGDTERVLILAKEAKRCVADLDMSLYGDIISEAMSQHKNHIAKALIDQCTPEQISQANPQLLIQAIWSKSNMVYDLAAKGIDANSIAYEVVRTLAVNHREYSFNALFNYGLNIANDNYSALYSCVKNNTTEMGKLLLDRGMSFDGYTQWCKANEITDNSGDTFNELKEHWDNAINSEQGEDSGQTMGGM